MQFGDGFPNCFRVFRLGGLKKGDIIQKKEKFETDHRAPK